MSPLLQRSKSLMRAGSQALPQPVKRVAKRADEALPWAAIHAGDRFQCPCCEGRFARLRSYDGRPNARCPKCGSLERHRVLWLYLTQRTDLLEQRLDVLHFAAEKPFEGRFRTLPTWRYVSADLHPTEPHQVRVDITSIQFPTASFDLVICNHVLVEVPDDRSAMQELFRVIKPGGLLISQEPVDSAEPAGAHEPRGRRPAGRNLRIYGPEYAELLSGVGFDVDCVPYADEAGADVAARHALIESGGSATGNAVYVAMKPRA